MNYVDRPFTPTPTFPVSAACSRLLHSRSVSVCFLQGEKKNTRGRKRDTERDGEIQRETGRYRERWGDTCFQLSQVMMEHDKILADVQEIQRRVDVTVLTPKFTGQASRLETQAGFLC